MLRMMKRILAISAIILLVSTMAFSQTEDSKPFIKTVNAQTFKELVDAGKGIILDVRTPQEVASGYISGASTINYYDEDFVAKINLIPKNKEIYVYCKSGGRSSEAAKLLLKNGFTRVYNLQGGIMGWQSSNFPIIKPNLTKDENIQEVSLDDFKKLLLSDKPVLIDFHTIWCAPCKKMAPIIDSIEIEYKDSAIVMRIDVDKSKDVANTYKIEGVPVFILFKNGMEVWKHNGMISKEELEGQIKKYLK